MAESVVPLTSSLRPLRYSTRSSPRESVDEGVLEDDSRVYERVRTGLQGRRSGCGAQGSEYFGAPRAGMYQHCLSPDVMLERAVDLGIGCRTIASVRHSRGVGTAHGISLSCEGGSRRGMVPH